MAGEVLTPSMIDVAAHGCGGFETGLYGRHDPRLSLKRGVDMWVGRLVHDTTRQGVRQADQWRYRFTLDALETLAHSDAGAARADLEASLEPDPHDFFLIQWLGSSATRSRYCDAALPSLDPVRSTSELLAAGQSLERREVFELAWRAVESEAAR